ncbi:MAG: cysteine-rich CWC family protein [Blastocatellia bacterium]
MLQKLTRLIQPFRRAPRACESCDQSFVCGASLKGCWCFNIKLSAAVRKQMRARYKDCLCRACLEMIARQSGKEERPDHR